MKSKIGKIVAVCSAALTAFQLILPLMLVMMLATSIAALAPSTNNTSNASSAGSDNCDELNEVQISAEGGGSGDVPDVVGMTAAQAEAWFGGLQGPNNVCRPYVYGQCAWWSCMREHKIGNTTGSHWGNGEKWVSSAIANGWREGVVAVGSVVSFKPGTMTQYADGSPGYVTHETAGHVAVIESVNEEAKTFTTSEKGGGTNVYSHVYSYNPLPSNMSVAAPPEGDGQHAVTGDASSDLDFCSPDGSNDSGNGTTDKDGWHASPEVAKQIAKDIIKTGYPSWDNDEQWAALDALWIGESGWRWNADNPSSDAYGIPQSLPGSKMASAGEDWADNAATQIKWGLTYIKQRYGSPAQAYAEWNARNPHWY